MPQIKEQTAAEIRTPYFGDGLDGILNARQAVLSGILNGIDREFFDPAADPALPARFDVNAAWEVGVIFCNGHNLPNLYIGSACNNLQGLASYINMAYNKIVGIGMSLNLLDFANNDFFKVLYQKK